jgi:hypothetical protein
MQPPNCEQHRLGRPQRTTAYQTNRCGKNVFYYGRLVNPDPLVNISTHEIHDHPNSMYRIREGLKNNSKKREWIFGKLASPHSPFAFCVPTYLPSFLTPSPSYKVFKDHIIRVHKVKMSALFLLLLPRVLWW